MLYIGSIYLLKARGRAGWAAAMKTGPNDASGHVVWVIGTCFIFLNHVFYILTNNLCYI